MTIPVRTSLPAGVTLGAVTFYVKFDPGMLDAITCVLDPNAHFDSKTCNLNYNHDGISPDMLAFTMISSAGVSGDQPLANISFELIGTPGSSSDLQLVVDTFTDPSGVSVPVAPPDHAAVVIQYPVPTLSAIGPTNVPPGSDDFTLVVMGTNFVNVSKVYWNADLLDTTFVSDTQLTAFVPANMVAAQGFIPIAVVTPTPGGGASGAEIFTIHSLVQFLPVIWGPVPPAPSPAQP